MIGWIDERLDLLSLPPSLTTENLDRALKVGSLSERFTPSDQQLYAQHVIPTLVRYFHAVYASETVEWRADNIRKAVKQPTFSSQMRYISAFHLSTAQPSNSRSLINQFIPGADTTTLFC